METQSRYVRKGELKQVDSKEGKELVQMLISYKSALANNMGKVYLRNMRQQIFNYQEEHEIELAAPLSMHF